MLHELFKRRLLFFTGKGGVGKSTVVASLALAAARLGKRPLVVEIDTDSAMKRLFKAPFVGFVPLPVADNVRAISLNPREALVEYIEEYVRIQRLARMIVNNKLLQYFFRTAPGVNEFVELHKLCTLLDEKDEAGQRAYDLLLVDLPATGHALRFLTLPQTVRQLIGVGPLKRVLDRFEVLFNDPDNTALSLVTLPEEMPVSETIELYDTLRARTNLPLGLLFVNAVPDRAFDADEAELLKRLDGVEAAAGAPREALDLAARSLDDQRNVEARIQRLCARVPMEPVLLPRLASRSLGPEHLAVLASGLLARRGEAA